MQGIKDAITKVFNKANEAISKVLNPIVEKKNELFSGEYLILIIIGLFFLVIFLIGLVRWISRSPKTFVTVLAFLLVIIATWYFLGGGNK